jgi:hypothetical protein
MSIIHAYSQTVADGTATSVVRPSDWNSAHNQVLNIGGNTAGTSQISGSDIIWAGGNNITLSASSNGVTVIGPNTVAQTVQTQASGNIVGAGFTTTTVAGAVVAATQNSAGLLMAVPSYLTTGANSTHSHNFATTTTNGSNIVVGTANSVGATIGVPPFITTFAAQTNQTAASGNIAGTGYTSTTQAGTTVGVTQNTAGLSVAWPPFITNGAGGGGFNAGVSTDALGTTGLVASQIVFFEGNTNITLSQSVNGNSASLSIYAPAGGGGGGANTIGGYEIFQLNNATTFTTLGQNSIYMQKFLMPVNASFNNFERRASLSTVSSALSVQGAYTIDYGLYSIGTGASTSIYQLIASSRMFMQASYSSNLSAGFTVSQGAASVTNSSAGTVNMSALSGFKHMYMPFSSTITAGGNYAFAMNISSATTGNTGALRIAFKDMTNYTNLSVGRISPADGISISAASRVGDWAQGVYSVTSAGLPNTLALSGLTNQVGQARMYLQLDV